MPVDVMLLSAAIIAVFLIFGFVLLWGDLRTRAERQIETRHKTG